MEGDAVVVAVDLKQEVLQDIQFNMQGREEVQIGEHHLQKNQHLRLLPLPVSEHHFITIIVENGWSLRPEHWGNSPQEIITGKTSWVIIILTSCQKLESSSALSLRQSPAANYGNRAET